MAELEGAVAEQEPAILGGDDGSDSTEGIGEDGGIAGAQREESLAAGDDTQEGLGETKEPVEQPEPGFEKLPSQYSKDKFVKGLYHANQELRKAFPGGVREAIEVKGKLEGLGGVEALDDIETQRAGWERIDKDFAEGNPGVLEDIAAESPEGFVKLMGPALDKFRQVDQAAYNHSLGKVFWNTMEGGGPASFLSSLAGVREALGRGDTDGAIAKFSGVEQWVDGIRGFASKVPEKSIDPEREKFQTEKAKWESDREQTFKNETNGTIRDQIAVKVAAQLEKEVLAAGRDFKALKERSPGKYQTLINLAHTNIVNAIRKDSLFVKRYNESVAARNGVDAAKLVASRADKLYADVVSRTYKDFYADYTDGKKTTPAAQPPKLGQQKVAPGTMRLTKPPTPENLDKLRMYKEFGKDRADSMVFNSKGYLKGKPSLYDWN